MPTEIYLVKVGMSMTEGVVEEWYIPDGSTVSTGEMLYRLETEKVNLDVDAEASGTVRHIVGEGVTLEPGDVVGYIFAPGEAIPDDLAAGVPAGGNGEPTTEVSSKVAAVTFSDAPAEPRVSGARQPSSPAARRLAAESNVDILALTGTGPNRRVVEADVRAAASAPAVAAVPAAAGGARSSPNARRLARELDVDLNSVTGTGPGGRITREDVEQAASAPPAANTPAHIPAQAPATDTGGPAAGSTIPVKGMRKTIAQRMHDSLATMAQLTMDMDVCMDDAVRLRQQLLDEWSDEGLRPTYTDLVVRAAAKALTAHPLMNSQFGDTEITLLADVNVGMAVALAEGLIVPVVRNANQLSMRDLAVESARLATAARDGKLGVDDLADGTFTVSTLGMFGVDSFTPIINAPQAGILGVNRLREDVAWEGNVPVKKQMMRLSLTWDHRVLDGAPAAQFLAAVRDLLEAPYRLLI